MSVIRDAFQADVPESVIAMSSGMSIGAGRSGCMCGALNGGILALGMFFGRTTPDGPKDPKVNSLMALSKELHDWSETPTLSMPLAAVFLPEALIWQGESIRSSVLLSQDFAPERLQRFFAES